MENHKKERIVILGAGFAGLKLARELQKSDYQIYLIDKHNYHQFQPLLYQVATARLEPSSVSFPLRRIFQNHKNVHIRLGKIQEIDLEHKQIKADHFSVNYDKLVIALGCETNYFGNAQLQKYSMPMKSSQEALALRNRILLTFEHTFCAPKEDHEAMMNFVVVGAGPTGVELSGALAEMKKYILPKDYPDMDFSQLKIHLVEGADATLPAMSDNAQKYSEKYLKELGVEVHLNKMVKSYDGRTLVFNDDSLMETGNVIWAAGVKGIRIPGIPDDVIVRGNRITVDRFNRVVGLEDVFAIGDIAYMETEKYPQGHPQLANVATNQALQLGKNLIHQQKGKQMIPFEYINKGTMATVGKRKAVVDLPRWKFQGRFAWLTWMVVHFWLILNVRNKLIIFINWISDYFNNDSTLRIIMRAHYSKAKLNLPVGNREPGHVQPEDQKPLKSVNLDQ